MQNEKIQLQRIKRLIERQNEKLYVDITELQAEFSPDGNNYKPIQSGETWGQPWDTGFFKIKGTIPQELGGKNYGLYFDCEGEACYLENGTPIQGLTPKLDWYHQAAKFYLPLYAKYAPGKEFELIIDASANNLFGTDKNEYKLRKCVLCTFDEEVFQKLMDIGLLLNLAEALPMGTVRRQRIIYGLVKVCDVWNSDQEKAQSILIELLSHPAHSSALTAFSVGQAHLDLAWLWPLKESRRKGGRTFANALRLLEQYPFYIFGASQAQLYQWIKEDYPRLYEEVKERIKQGRWEVQGSSWVEFDTNLISGESIIRQFMYGKSWFTKEFGLAPSCLWLPDCFGFSGNLPQYLKGCGVDWFMTQKLSWNESNTFPHHLFMWEGIDGSRILAHQLPTNDYNFSNNPAAFLETEKRFAESEISDAYLNLFGIGDGGGGPTRNHIEYGKRQQNLEGVSKFRFAKSTEFYEYISKLDKDALPVMYGELYLEFHRGTYTTQARMKENNRISERKLAAAEYICVLAGINKYPELLHDIWHDTLLLQFHDILPGSSITPVYEDAARISEANHQRLDSFMQGTVEELQDKHAAADGKVFLAINPCNQDLDEWQAFDEGYAGLQPGDEMGKTLPWITHGDKLMVRLQIPAWGSKMIEFRNAAQTSLPCHSQDAMILENSFLKVTISPRGSILSIWDKEQSLELLAAESNLLKLWEDEPNNWGAWDINHFYRDTTPELPSEAKLNKDLSINVPDQFQRLVQDLQLGKTMLQQTIELRNDERFIRISHQVDWQENHKMLRTHFYPEVYSGIATYGIQGGVIQRSSKPKNAWEAARFEVPAQRFADLSQAERGCALLCDTKFGYRSVDNEMEINLLRSPADVDPTADIHSHEYHYAFYPHQGDYAHSEVFNAAEKLANRLILLPLEHPLKHIMDPLFRLESDSVNLDIIKPAENGKGIILRMHEYKGQSITAVLCCMCPEGFVQECNMLENSLDEEAKHLDAENPLQLSFRPFETKTLRFTG